MKRSEIWSARTGRPWFSLWIVEHCPTATTRLATAWRVCWNVHEGLCSVSWRLWTLNVSWVFSDTQRVFSVQSSQTFAKYVRLSLLSQMQQKQHVWRASKKTIIGIRKLPMTRYVYLNNTLGANLVMDLSFLMYQIRCWLLGLYSQVGFPSTQNQTLGILAPSNGTKMTLGLHCQTHEVL